MVIPLFETTADDLLFFASGNLACQRASESRSPKFLDRSPPRRRRRRAIRTGVGLGLAGSEADSVPHAPRATSALECSVSAELWICRGATFFGWREIGTTRKSKGLRQRVQSCADTQHSKVMSIRGRIAGRVGGSAAVRLRRNGLVRREGGEPFGLRVALVSQGVKQHDARASGHPRTSTCSRVVLLSLAGRGGGRDHFGGSFDGLASVSFSVAWA